MSWEHKHPDGRVWVHQDGAACDLPVAEFVAEPEQITQLFVPVPSGRVEITVKFVAKGES